MNSANVKETVPLVSVVVVNYNCMHWLDRFFKSLQAQSIFDQSEIIMVDNTSKDGSTEICAQKMAQWPNGIFLPTGGNYGFGGGCNRGAKIARGKYLFFLNPDVWLEPNCLQELVFRSDEKKTKVACPLILNYSNDEIQGLGTVGFDIFGNMLAPRPCENVDLLFAVATFFFIERNFFHKLGGFDEEFFLFNEEMDLSWRVWLAGGLITLIRSAKIHHQFASNDERATENRTNESKRFYANRSQLLTILKDAQGPLLFLVLSQFFLIMLEAIIGAILARRLSFLRWALLKPIADCWRLRRHILKQRQKIRTIRLRSDWWILHSFFRFGFGRWSDVQRLLKSGIKIDKA